MTTTTKLPQIAADDARGRSAAELRELMAEGAVKITEAAKFTGIGRTKLFSLFREHHALTWLEGSARMVPRRELQRVLAERAAAALARERGEVQ